MIYTPEHCLKILRCQKTATRRLVKPGDFYICDGTDANKIIEVRVSKNAARGNYAAGNSRLKYKVGNTYSIQPGRGKKSMGRTLLTGIKLQYLQDITLKEIEAEGLSIPEIARAAQHLDCIWTDEQLEELTLFAARLQFGQLWDDIHEEGMWDCGYDVWALAMELVA